MSARIRAAKGRAQASRRTHTGVLIVAVLLAALAITPVSADHNGPTQTSGIANGAVTPAKLRNGAVTPAKLRNGAVRTSKLAAAAVTGGKVAANTLTAGHIDFARRLGGGLDVLVDSERALRLEPHPDSPNVIGGFPGNEVTGAVKGAAIGGGGEDTLANLVSDDFGTVGGGSSNTASGPHATVPGGLSNTAAGDSSLAAGRRAKANHNGAFVWADSQNFDVQSTANNQFVVRAGGGIWLGTHSSPSIPAGRFINTSTGAHLTTGGVWTNSSDAAAKTGFASVEPTEVLDKVAELPVRTWSYKAEEGVRHIGPTAQDFKAAFGVGSSDRHIASLDTSGVALSAIQGLNQKVEAQQAQIASLTRAADLDDAGLATASDGFGGLSPWLMLLVAAVGGLAVGLGTGLARRLVPAPTRQGTPSR